MTFEDKKVETRHLSTYLQWLTTHSLLQYSSSHSVFDIAGFEHPWRMQAFCGCCGSIFICCCCWTSDAFTCRVPVCWFVRVSLIRGGLKCIKCCGCCCCCCCCTWTCCCETWRVKSLFFIKKRSFPEIQFEVGFVDKNFTTK